MSESEKNNEETSWFEDTLLPTIAIIAVLAMFVILVIFTASDPSNPKGYRVLKKLKVVEDNNTAYYVYYHHKQTRNECFYKAKASKREFGDYKEGKKYSENRIRFIDYDSKRIDIPHKASKEYRMIGYSSEVINGNTEFFLHFKKLFRIPDMHPQTRRHLLQRQEDTRKDAAIRFY